MIQRLIIIVIAVLCINLQCIAQSEPVPSPATVTNEKTGEEGAVTTDEQPQEETTTEDTEKEIQAKVKHTLAYEVLGRELTQREKDTYGDSLTKEDLKNILAGEQKLAIVRALITLDSEDSTKDVLNVYHISKVQTYTELVSYFSGLIEKYGSVKTGIESEYVYNIKDNEQAFRKAASKAYETVFGIPEDKQNKEQIFNFLIQSNALTYSKMIRILMKTITPDIKKQMLFNALENIGRPDLKTNDKFVKNMLEQEFTYKNLTELLKDLQGATPAQTVQGKKSPS